MVADLLHSQLCFKTRTWKSIGRVTAQHWFLHCVSSFPRHGSASSNSPTTLNHITELSHIHCSYTGISTSFVIKKEIHQTTLTMYLVFTIHLSAFYNTINIKHTKNPVYCIIHKNTTYCLIAQLMNPKNSPLHDCFCLKSQSFTVLFL